MGVRASFKVWVTVRIWVVPIVVVVGEGASFKVDFDYIEFDLTRLILACVGMIRVE